VAISKEVFDCPHCQALCEFRPIVDEQITCKTTSAWHSAWMCMNCRGLILATKYAGSDYKLLPSFKRKAKIQTDRLPDAIRRGYFESLITFSNNCNTACVIMCRRVIQQACLLQGAVGKALYDQIESMELDKSLKQLAHKIRFWGNSGAHPDLLLEEQVTEDDATLAIDFTEKFLDFVFVIPAELSELEDKTKNR